MKFTTLLFVAAAALAAQSPADDKRLVFSTFHGGDRNDDAVAVAVDPAGFIYMAGETESQNLGAKPVGGKPLTSAVFNAYLTKYAPEGKQVVWRKLIGGESNTVPHAVALDRDGNVYVAGTTGARDLPMVHPVQDKQTGLNISFLMKLSPDGDLLFSTYFGGNRNEEGLAVALDSGGNIYLAGRATSTDLPVKNALQSHLSGGGQDAFIAKYTPDYQLAYATYIGGTSGTDNIYAIAIGPDDSLYVAGETMSPGLATEHAYQTIGQGYSSFVARLNPQGDAITYFTYVGWKGGYTTIEAIVVDSQGRAYVGGHTTSKQLPTTENALQSTYAGGFRDAFLLRLNPEGTSAEYLTYLGGSSSGPTDPDESITALRIDQRGFLYAAGHTNSADFPGNQRAVQPNSGGGEDSFLMRLDVDNRQVIYSTFWGGAKKDSALALSVGPGEAATLAGVTYSDDLPLANAVQAKLGSANDAFVAQICDPWLGYWFGDIPAAAFNHVTGGQPPLPIEGVVYSGCTQKFEAAGPESDQPWLTVVRDGSTVPMKLRLEVNPEGLAPGEYKATIKVTVKEAFLPVLEIPVSLTVTELPPPPSDVPPSELR